VDLSDQVVDAVKAHLQQGQIQPQPTLEKPTHHAVLESSPNVGLVRCRFAHSPSFSRSLSLSLTRARSLSLSLAFFLSLCLSLTHAGSIHTHAGSKPYGVLLSNKCAS